MRVDLDMLLETIERIPDEVSCRVDEAVNTFVPPAMTIDSWRDYEHCLASLFCHIECSILGISPVRPVNLGFDRGRCFELLRKEWGRNGDKAGFEMARTGNEGGLLKVLRTVARLMTKQHADDQIETLTSLYRKNRSVDELLQDARDYVTKYGHMLPQELTEQGATRLIEAFYSPGRIMKEHVQMMQRTRQVGRGRAVGAEN